MKIKIICKFKLTILVVIFLLITSEQANATSYTFPGNVTQGPLVLNPGTNDTFTQTSGTFETPATSATAYTINSTGDDSDGAPATTISQTGGTITYAGTTTSAAAILINNNNVFDRSVTLTFDFAGTVSNGTGTNAIDASSGETLFTTYIFNLTGSFTGPVLLNATSTLNVDGSSAATNNISGGHQLNLGQTTAVNLTTGGTISNMPAIALYSGSFTVANNISGLTASGSGTSAAFSIASGTNLNISASVTGTGTTSNAGTMKINSGGTYNVSGAFTNNSGTKTINIQGTFVVPASFTNSGTINVDGTVAAITTNTLTGTTGAILNIGMTDSSTNFTPAVLISGIPTINVLQGTFGVTNGISGVTNLAFSAGAFVNISSAVTGSGTFSNAATLTLTHNFDATQFGTSSSSSGIINVDNVTLTVNSSFSDTGKIYVNQASGTIAGALVGSGSASLIVGSDSSGNLYTDTNYTTQNTISGVPTIQVTAGTFTVANAISGVNTSFSVASGATAVLNASFTSSGGSPTAVNQGTLTINSIFNIPLTNGSSSTTGAQLNLASTGLSAPITNDAGNSLSVTGATTSTSTISTAGTMTVSAALSTAGVTVTSGGNLNLATNAAVNAGNVTVNQGGNMQITGSNVTTAVNTSNSGTLTFNGNLTSTTGSITNNAGGTVIFASGSNATNITNQSSGNLNVTGSFSNTATLTNNGTMTVSAALNSASGTINNNAAGNLILTAGSSVANMINSSGTITVTGNTTISNYNLTSAGTLSMSGNINMPGLNLTNSGTAYIHGQRTLTANSYISSGKTVVSITGGNVYDSLTTNGTMNFAGGTLQVVAGAGGPANTVQSFTVLDASGGIQNLTYGQVTIPTTTFYEQWQVTIYPNSVVVGHVSNVPLSNLNARIAAVLAQMAQNITNAGQQQLIDDFAGLTSNFNQNLHQMIPINNAMQLDFDLQNSIFNKVQTRIAALRDEFKTSPARGLNAGDIAPDTDMWMSTFGAWTNQGRNSDDDGFNAKTGAMFLGMDNRVSKENYVGAAIGFSDTHTTEFTSAGFINHAHRYHGLLYGTHNMKHGNYYDLLVSTNYNVNNCSRMINVNGNILSTKGKFHGYQIAAKLIRGKAIDFWESYRLRPLVYLQYVNLHQNAYSETGSVAALSVEERTDNIVTLGLGTKFDFPLDAWQCFGMRELRAILSYDVYSPNNVTTANFVVGSNSFQIISAPARLALQLGAGMTFEFMDNILFEMNYDFEVRSRFTDNVVMAKVRYLF